MNINVEDFLRLIRLLDDQQHLIEELIKIVEKTICLGCYEVPRTGLKFCKACRNKAHYNSARKWLKKQKKIA